MLCHARCCQFPPWLLVVGMGARWLTAIAASFAALLPPWLPVALLTVAALHSFGLPSCLRIVVAVMLPPADCSLTDSRSFLEYLPCHAHFTLVLCCFASKLVLECCKIGVAQVQVLHPPEILAEGPRLQDVVTGHSISVRALVLSSLCEYRQKICNNYVVGYFLGCKEGVRYAFVNTADDFFHSFVWWPAVEELLVFLVISSSITTPYWS